MFLRGQGFLIYFYLFLQLINASILTIFDDNATMINNFTIHSPAFSLGNQNFPINGTLLRGFGCSTFESLDKSNQILKTNNSSNLNTNTRNSYIVFIIQNTDDRDCVSSHYILQCQQRVWCIGVIVEEKFFNPGFTMWSVFDKHRKRSDYKVPLVQISDLDMILVDNIVQNPNHTHLFIMTSDHNPWIDMFSSVAFTVYFRILSSIWSFGCLVLSAMIFFENRKIEKLKDKKSVNIKQSCLIFQIVTHISRVALFSVDPLFSQQIYPQLISYLLLTCSICFEIASSILMSFVIRELTKANTVVSIGKRVKAAYCFIFIFLVIDLTFTTFAGIETNTKFRAFMIVAGFYVFSNIILGLWYFWQGYTFLKYISAHKKILQRTNESYLVLTRISLVCSVGFILFGASLILTIIRDVMGKPWGYFFCWVAIVLVTQFTCFIQTLLFGLNSKTLAKVKEMFRFNRSNKLQRVNVLSTD